MVVDDLMREYSHTGAWLPTTPEFDKQMRLMRVSWKQINEVLSSSQSRTPVAGTEGGWRICGNGLAILVAPKGEHIWTLYRLYPD